METNFMKIQPLHLAVNQNDLNSVKILVENGAMVNARNKDNHTPLHISAADGSKEIVKILIENGASIDIQNQDQETALHIAVKENELEVVKYLVENGALVNAKNKDNFTPHFLAAKLNFNDIVEYLTKMKKCKAESEPGEIINSKDPCIMCFEPRNGWYVLMPCGHTSLCESCCIKITCKEDHAKCPTCRKPINSYNQIFFQKPE